MDSTDHAIEKLYDDISQSIDSHYKDLAKISSLVSCHKAQFFTNTKFFN